MEGGGATPVGRKRYVMALLCLWITTICYADRTNIGIALPSFVDSKEEQGEVLSAFFYGYMATQILGGYFATKLGAKTVLLTGVVVWTLFDLSTIFVSRCAWCLFLARAGMGLGEGILFPCMHQLSGAWYPLQERSRLVAFVSSGSDLGTITALILSSAILEASGWQRIFIVFGVFSFVWVVAFALFGVSNPETDPTISRDEKDYILANRTLDPMNHRRQFQSSATIEHEPLNWSVLLTSRPAWAIYIAHFCYNYSWYVLLGWIPLYFRQELHLDLGKNGVTAALPYMCGYVGAILFGRIADILVARGFRVLHVRQLMNGIGFVGSACFLFALRFATDAPSAVALLSLTLYCSRASMAGYWVNMIDIGPNHAAHVMGVSNTFATLPGIIGNVVTGKILAATGRWDVVFGIASLVLVFGALVFHFNASDHSIYVTNGSSSGTNSTSSGSPEYGIRAPLTPKEELVGLLDGE
ncbi:Sialin-like protein, partial [Globisporangium splendens]